MMTKKIFFMKGNEKVIHETQAYENEKKFATKHKHII
jgi:hypothetical protein